MEEKGFTLEDFDSISLRNIGGRFDLSVNAKNLKYTITTFSNKITEIFFNIEDVNTEELRQSAFKMSNDKFKELSDNLNYEDKDSVIKFFNNILNLSNEETADLIFVKYE